MRRHGVGKKSHRLSACVEGRAQRGVVLPEQVCRSHYKNDWAAGQLRGGKGGMWGCVVRGVALWWQL